MCNTILSALRVLQKFCRFCYFNYASGIIKVKIGSVSKYPIIIGRLSLSSVLLMLTLVLNLCNKIFSRGGGLK